MMLLAHKLLVILILNKQKSIMQESSIHMVQVQTDSKNKGRLSFKKIQAEQVAIRKGEKNLYKVLITFFSNFPFHNNLVMVVQDTIILLMLVLLIIITEQEVESIILGKYLKFETSTIFLSNMIYLNENIPSFK